MRSYVLMVTVALCANPIVARAEGALPRRDARADARAKEQEFRAQLGRAIELQRSGKCMIAYAMLRVIGRDHLNDPDVLWGLAECGAQVARVIPDADQRRDVLRDARDAYLAYPNAEHRAKYRERRLRAAVCVEALNRFVTSGDRPPADCAAPPADATPTPTPEPEAAVTPPPLIPLAAVVRPATPTPQALPAIAPLAAPPPTPSATHAAAPVATPTPRAPDRAAASLAVVHERWTAAERSTFSRAAASAQRGAFAEAISTAAVLCSAYPNGDACGFLVIWKTMTGDCAGALAAYGTLTASAHAAVHAAARDCARTRHDVRVELDAQERYITAARYVDPRACRELGDALREFANAEFRAGRDAIARDAYTRAERAYRQYLALEHRPKTARERRRVTALVEFLGTPPPNLASENPDQRLARCQRLGIAQSKVVRQADGSWVEIVSIPASGTCPP